MLRQRKTFFYEVKYEMQQLYAKLVPIRHYQISVSP